MKKALAIIICLTILCGCEANKQPEETDHVEPLYTTSPQAETEAAPLRSETAASATVTLYIPEETEPAPQYIPESIDIDMDSENSARLGITRARLVTVLNARDSSLDFLSGLTYAECIRIENCTDVSNIIAPLQKAGDIGLQRLFVTASAYTKQQAEQLMTAFPSVMVSYEQAGGLELLPEGEKDFFTVYPLLSLTDTNAESSLICEFNNSSERVWHLGDIRILYRENDKREPVTFSNGKDSEPINKDLFAGESFGYTLPDSLFDLETAPVGRYIAAVSYWAEGGEELSESRDFFVSRRDPHAPMEDWQLEYIPSPDLGEGFDIYARRYRETYNFFGDTPDFLDEQQLKAYNSALWVTYNFFGFDRYISEEYAASHSGSELIDIFAQGYTREYAEKKAAGLYIDESGDIIPFNGGGKGSDITFSGLDFFPVYSSENEVLFRAEIIHSHPEMRGVLYESRSFHMIRTEEGWRFDVFELWL